MNFGGRDVYDWGGSYFSEFFSTYAIRNELTNYQGEVNEEKAKVWREAFEKIFTDKNILDKNGNPKKPVLITGYEIPDYLRSTLDDYIPVTLSKNWTTLLNKIGIPTEKDIIPEYIEEILPTSLTLEYGSEIWDAQRIVLDAVQNHLPADTRGNSYIFTFSNYRWRLA